MYEVSPRTWEPRTWERTWKKLTIKYKIYLKS